jgi:hypothetical protein
MAAVRVNITIEVDQKGNGLLIEKPMPVQLIHEREKWRLRCHDPALETEGFDTMEQALIAGARLIGDEMQAAVVERPAVLGKITPQGVSSMFR